MRMLFALCMGLVALFIPPLVSTAQIGPPGISAPILPLADMMALPGGEFGRGVEVGSIGFPDNPVLDEAESKLEHAFDLFEGIQDERSKLILRRARDSPL